MPIIANLSLKNILWHSPWNFIFRKTSFLVMGTSVSKTPSRQAITEIYNKHILPDPYFFVKVYEEVINRSKTIAQILEIDTDNESYERKVEKLKPLAMKVKKFIQLLIKEPNTSARAQMAFECGARHTVYAERKFQSLYWDVFILAITETLEQSKTNPKSLEVYKWQQFVREVVDHMRRGYEKQLHNSPNCTQTTASNGD